MRLLDFFKVSINRELDKQKPGIIALAEAQINQIPDNMSLDAVKSKVVEIVSGAVSKNITRLPGYQQVLIAGILYQFSGYLDKQIGTVLSTSVYKKKAIVVVDQFIEGAHL